jgi:hypothetical protein
MDTNQYAYVRCDWCYEDKTCRSLHENDVWIMSVCKQCWDLDSKEMGYANV